MAGFFSSQIDDTNSTTINNNIDSDKEIITDDITIALNNLDALLSYMNIGGQSLSSSEFVEIDSDIPVFNERDDINDNLIIVDEDYDSKKNNNNSEEDDDIPTETPPTIIEAMEMVRRLHLLAATQQLQLHLFLSWTHSLLNFSLTRKQLNGQRSMIFFTNIE